MHTIIIKDIPNTEEGLHSAALLKIPKWTKKRHGRGYRHQKRSYWRELPMNLAQRFTYYQYDHEYRSPYIRDYYRYVGAKNGKIRLRYLGNEDR